MSQPSSEAVTDVAAGTLIAGRYRVKSLLGEGGMARVFEATTLTDDATVVIKLPRRITGTATARFQREIEAISRVEHPAIVRVLEAGIDPALGVPFMVLERVIGPSLAERVRRDGPLPELEARRILREIAEGLRAVYAESILHRDLTPHNVMLDQSGRVRILDFGLVKILDAAKGPPLTQPLTTLGTPAFMSPEQITGRNLDGRSDLYALGCLAHFLLTAKAPFDRREPLEVMRAHLDLAPPALPEKLVDGQAPKAGLIKLISVLLEKDPNRRPADASQVVRSLRALEQDDGQAPTGPLPLPTPTTLGATEEELTAVVPKEMDANESGTTGGDTTRLVEMATPTGPSLRTSTEVRTARWRWSLAAAAISASALALGWALSFASSAGVEASAPIPAPVTAPSSPQVVPAPRPAAVRGASIYSTPSPAQVYVGDERLGITPLELPAERLPLQLTVRAEGHQPRTVWVERAGDVIIALTPVEVEPKRGKTPPKRRPAPEAEVPVW
ncbi:MAG: serine/threonine protein kinase [Deltaproteobacteria bacterium]|nr:serine/threonine protein kinase [Deltaproteobacteria bacterium]